MKSQMTQKDIIIMHRLKNECDVYVFVRRLSETTDHHCNIQHIHSSHQLSFSICSCHKRIMQFSSDHYHEKLLSADLNKFFHLMTLKQKDKALMSVVSHSSQ